MAAVMSMMKRRWGDQPPGGGYSLADQLGVPWSKQVEIRQQHHSLSQQQVALARYTVDFLPRISWSTLAGALYYCEEKAALQAAGRYIKREEGKLCSVIQLCNDTFLKWRGMGHKENPL